MFGRKPIHEIKSYPSSYEPFTVAGHMLDKWGNKAILFKSSQSHIKLLHVHNAAQSSLAAAETIWNTAFPEQRDRATFPFPFTGPFLKSTVMCTLFSFQLLKRIYASLSNSPKHSLLHFEAMGSSHSLVIWLLLTEMRSQEKNLVMLKNSFLFEHNLQWDVKIWSK